MKKRAQGLLGLLCLIIGLTACSKPTQTATDRPIVYVSAFPMYSLAKSITGDLFDLHILVPSGTEPHDWEPSAREMAGLENAKLLIVSGAGFEPWLTKVQDALGDKMPPVCVASQGIALLDADENEIQESSDHDSAAHDREGLDPHVWMNPQYASQECDEIALALSESFPEYAKQIESQNLEFQKQIKQLDMLFIAKSARWTQKRIVVSHQAYGYLCEAYGIEQIALEGLMADSEPSPARLAELTQLLQEYKIKTIFVEPSQSSKAAKTLAKETGAQIQILNPFETMSQEDIDRGITYIDVMQENLDALQLALGD